MRRVKRVALGVVALIPLWVVGEWIGDPTTWQWVALAGAAGVYALVTDAAETLWP